MTDATTPAALLNAVRAALSDASQSGATITARQIRAKCEEALGLPADGLLGRKEELMAMISSVLQQQSGDAAGGPAGASEVDPAAVSEAVTALEDAEVGPTRAALLVAELNGEGGVAAAEAMVLLSEVCASSAVAASRLIDANACVALAALLPPAAPKVSASLAVRMLSAMALHATLTERLVRSTIVAPLLARIGASIDGVGVQCAALLHNLADSPSNRMRLLHAGCLTVIVAVMVEPSASGGLKEHLLQAAASLAGQPEAEASLPDLLGAFLVAKVPGTQRSALSSVQIIRERQPGIEGRLAGCEPLMQGLARAAKSADAQVASEAAAHLEALKAAQ